MIIVLPLAVKGIAADCLPNKGENKDNQDIPQRQSETGWGMGIEVIGSSAIT